MKVYCPQHKTGFFTPRKNPIRCENRGHVLGDFIFHGDAGSPVETLWQYCCNCEHFCPIELNGSALETCPACARRISQLYLCDQCFTLSFESSTLSQAKNFTLTSDGAPQPSCPGCFKESSGELHEHDCEELGARFESALNACPFCLERFDAGPAFPSSAAQFLKKTRAANKVDVAFDYATGLFLPGDNGEFILVCGNTRTSRPFVLPRSTRFASKSDFYEVYQDYYHCPNVNPGELHIIEPAFVESVGNGWKLQSMGTLEIVSGQPNPDVQASKLLSKTESTVRESPPLFSATFIQESPAPKASPATPIEKSSASTCTQCGSLVESRYAFCWNCAHSPKVEEAAFKKVEETTTFPRRIFSIEDESTVQQHVTDVQPRMFSWTASQPSGASPRSTGLKLTAIVAMGLVLVALAVVLLKAPVSQLGHSSEAQLTSNLQATTDTAPRAEKPTVAIAEPTKQIRPTTNAADDELRKLREKLIGALPSDRSAVIQLTASIEEEFPDDYRFPYERAKLVINARETRSHHDAFNALSLAAEKAIDANKAEEMLRALEADAVRDFRKLSRGHSEWTQIVEALERSDSTLLTLRE